MVWAGGGAVTEKIEEKHAWEEKEKRKVTSLRQQ